MQYFLAFLLFFSFSLSAEEKHLKVLHLCFHDGCVREIEGIAKELAIDLTSWNIHSLPPYFFDYATSGGNVLYNIGHERAYRVWEKHKDYFNQFDLVITSDTTPLSRIFIQNGWSKPLIIWVSNRFDWGGGNSDCDFPDIEYYDLLRFAKNLPNVFFVASTPFEIYYAKQKNVDLGDRVIEACACYLSDENKQFTKNPKVFVHKRTENVQSSRNPHFVISKLMQKIGIPTACYEYDPKKLPELGAYRAVLYLPYQWYAISFFETLQLGLPTFVPSETFMTKLIKENDYFFENSDYLINKNLYSLSEWYNPQIRDILIYFDSWQDLKKKYSNNNFTHIQEKTIAYAKRHKHEMINRWKEVFNQAQKLSSKEQ